MNALTTRLFGRTAATLDHAMLVAARLERLRRRSSTERLPHAVRIKLLELASDAYADPALFKEPDRFFSLPEPIAPTLRFVRRAADGIAVFDVAWTSHYEPFLPSIRTKYLNHVPNRTAHARLFLGPEPRPAVILVHGYTAGQWRIEELVWPIRWLARKGLDVALCVLPFHALRAEPGASRLPRWPGADPRVTNEGFRQAMHDLRALLRWLKSRGSNAVGVMGMSLGGYSTALLATIERELSFAVPIVPLASLADFAHDGGRLGRGPEAREQRAKLEAANWIVSPLARPGLVAPERMLIIGAKDDCITPIKHAERLATHFGAPLVRIEGAHLVQFGIRDGYRAVAQMLKRLGIFRSSGQSAEPNVRPYGDEISTAVPFL